MQVKIQIKNFVKSFLTRELTTLKKDKDLIIREIYIDSDDEILKRIKLQFRKINSK